MLPALVKLCCGISYPHLRSMSSLQRTAVAVIGQEITHLQQHKYMELHTRPHAALNYSEPSGTSMKEESLMFVEEGVGAMRKALKLLEDKEGWKMEIKESNGDVVFSKVTEGSRKVFMLQAVLDASMDELYDILFLRVEEMHKWNPNVQKIQILKHVGPQTVVTHEVSAERAGNLIGQRDFLSVRHSCRQKSCVYLGGTAIHLESFPPQTGFVRGEDGPTCIVIEDMMDDGSPRSRFTWLLNMDVKGWLPTSIVNQALPREQLDFTRHLRTRLTAGVS
ncbi:steroidogenic acute regulatory protein, mitochondrial [Thalassophryne amazonica]|uniref:steroidogenic acute regulatory protein, mitochondrial n=1 Tax=Thalassophryne amazonica TaxID=390379 RepID=UPI00147128F8|nr:steroidogenic acute regulatory protein, mitochondrial [Thalassophryne amazonica]